MERGCFNPNVINEVPQIRLTEEEHQLLKLGPRFIFDDPKTASRRRLTELAALQRKIGAHFYEKKNYRKRSEEYVAETNAYQCVGTRDPLPGLTKRTSQYLLDLRLAKWITQKQYEQLSVKTDDVELAHLYYLPKAHKVGTPLRVFLSGLKHPTIKISEFLDNLLRLLFDQMTVKTTVMSGFELTKELQEW